MNSNTTAPIRQSEKRSDDHYTFEPGITGRAAMPTEDHEPRRSRVVAVRAVDVKRRNLDWLWHGRIGRGKLTHVVGPPGVGKSTVLCDWAARMSTGTPWPDRPDEDREPMDVVMLSGEDDPEDTIAPRLHLARADLARVHLIAGMAIGEKEYSFTLAENTAHLSEFIATLDNPGALLIDPISAFVGKVDSHKNAEVRGLLAPLAKLAMEHRIAVVYLDHLNKREGTNPLNRSQGSGAFIAAARASWLFHPDPENRERIIMATVKGNLAKDTGGLAYTLKGIPGEDHAYVAWEEGAVDITAQQLLGEKGKRPRQSRAAAIDFLESAMLTSETGEVPARELFAQAGEEGISADSLRRAFKQLGGTRRKSVDHWLWSLPQVGVCH